MFVISSPPFCLEGILLNSCAKFNIINVPPFNHWWMASQLVSEWFCYWCEGSLGMCLPECELSFLQDLFCLSEWWWSSMGCICRYTDRLRNAPATFHSVHICPCFCNTRTVSAVYTQTHRHGPTLRGCTVLLRHVTHTVIRTPHTECFNMQFPKQQHSSTKWSYQ